MKTVQYFSQAQLEHGKSLTPSQVAVFLEDFRLLHSGPSESKLISIKIPKNLLSIFRQRCEQNAVPYQTQIKNLMRDWLSVRDLT